MKSPYKRMLDGMAAKAEAGPAVKKEPWFLYVLECSDGSFYTGITNDLDRRLKTHNAGRGANFTRSRLPVKMIYREKIAGRAQALIREYALKSLTRKQKEAFIFKRRTAKIRRRKRV